MKRILFLIFTLVWINLSFAQSTDDILKLLVEKEMITQEDANALKKEEKKDSTTVLTKIKTAFAGSDVFKLSGYGQIVFNSTNNSVVTTNTDMRVNRIILFASGNLKPKLSYLIMYDFGPRSGLHECYGEYTPIDAISIRFGQYKVPFTLENPMSPTRWEGIYGSLSVNALAGISTDVIGAKAGRDMGLQLSGKLFKKNDFYRIEYYAGLFNGTGFNTPDNNNHKDFAGTLIFQPLKGLKLAGTGYSGKAPYVKPGESIPRNHVRNRWSAGGEFSSRNWYARSEYLYGNDGGIDRNGYYFTGMWKILPERLDFFGKYDYYNPDKNESSTAIREYTGGINYYFSFLSRVQLNYIHTDTKSQSYNTVAAQLQLFF